MFKRKFARDVRRQKNIEKSYANGGAKFSGDAQPESRKIQMQEREKERERKGKERKKGRESVGKRERERESECGRV